MLACDSCHALEQDGSTHTPIFSYELVLRRPQGAGEVGECLGQAQLCNTCVADLKKGTREYFRIFMTSKIKKDRPPKPVGNGD